MSTRFPQMMNGASIQEMNDPSSFQYGQPNGYLAGGLFAPAQDPVEEPNDESGFNFNDGGNRTPERISSPFGRELSVSPNKTGGQIQLRDLQAEDLSNEPFIGRDAVVVIEGEMRQFDGKRLDKVQRYVESLVTGNFMKVQKDINLQIQPKEIDEKTKKLQSNREFYEKEMKEIQRVWVNRVNKLFYMFLGLLAGMSLMHLLVVLNQPDKWSFMQLYSKISTVINIVFMIFSSFGVILGISLTMIYKQKSDEKMRNMDIFRMEFRQHYIVSMVITIIIAFCLFLLYILPRWTNKLYYWNPQNLQDMDVTITKGIFGATNVLFIVAWLLATAFNKASISDMDLDPEDLDETETVDNSSITE